MVRLDNWQRLFAEYLSDKTSEPFEWGKNDCILFGAGAVEAITGVNFYNQYLGYKSEAEAYEIIENNGGIEGLISKHLGAFDTNYLAARRGDLVMFMLPYKTIGVVDNSGEKIACLTEKGMARIPLNKAKKIWRVG